MYTRLAARNRDKGCRHEKEATMSTKQALHKIESVAENVGEKARKYASRGKKFLREKTSGIASAISKEKKKLWH